MTPADWHPDPTGRYERRYWDGSAWTAHVWSAGQQALDPSSGEPTQQPTRPQGGRFGREEFESVALAAAHGDSAALARLPATVHQAASLYRPKRLEVKKWELLALAVDDVLVDDRLNADEEQHLSHLAAALGLDLRQLALHNFAAYEDLMIAGMNDGRLPRADVPILVKPGEFGRASFNAALMKEVLIRENRGSAAGASVRIARGATYRTRQVRARSVVVGTQLQIQDVGVLSVTNCRAVFTGRARTVEFRFDKLVGMDQFKDGLRLSVTNRQLASLFRITPPSSPLVAAAVIAKSVAGAC